MPILLFFTGEKDEILFLIDLIIWLYFFLDFLLF